MSDTIETEGVGENPALARPTSDAYSGIPAPSLVRRCIHCGHRSREIESLQRDFDGVLDERCGLQEAMRQAIEISDSNDPAVRNRVRKVLADALEVLVPVVENHPAPVEVSRDKP